MAAGADHAEPSRLRATKSGLHAEATQVFLPDAMARIELAARTAIAACSEGDALRTNLAVLRRYARYDPVDAVALRRQIADRVLQAGRYV